MHREKKLDILVALERRILRRVCSSELPPPELSAVQRELVGYEWLGAEHQIVWDALTRMPRGVPELGKLLPAEAARMGFPDVEWGDFLSDRGERSTACEGEATGVMALLRELKEQSKK